MAQTRALIQTLKKSLKSHGLTYRDVAEALHLSEASVKRWFAAGRFTLARLDKVCQIMGMEISDLVRELETSNRRISELTETQEKEVVSDPKFVLVAFLVMNGWTLEDILGHYRLSEPEVIRFLVRLDKLKMIMLMPRNRIKLLISPNFAWRRNGPIYNFFADHVREEFLESRFDHPGEALVFLSGMLSGASSSAVTAKMEKLATEFNTMYREDQRLPLSERKGYSLLLAVRSWELHTFDQLRK